MNRLLWTLVAVAVAVWPRTGAAAPLLVYRYYNPTSEDHFYTTNYQELQQVGLGYGRENFPGTFSTSPVSGPDLVSFYRG
jgi:hypothetical protein